MVEDKNIVIIHGKKKKQRNELHFNHKKSFKASVSKDKKKEIHRNHKYGDKGIEYKSGDHL